MKGIKTLVLLAVLALAVSLISGCGQKQPPGQSDLPPGAENIKPPAATVDPTDFAGFARQMGARKGLKSWRATMTTDAEQTGGSFQMAMMGQKVRVEDANRPNTYQVLDAEAGTMLMVDTAKKTAMEMKLNMGEEQQVPDPAEELAKIQQDDPNAKFSSTELDGRKVWLVEFKDVAGNGSKSWFDKEWGLPLKTENTAGGKTETILWTYTDVNSVPESDFAAPAGYKVLKMDLADPTKMTPEQLKQMQEFMGNN